MDFNNLTCTSHPIKWQKKKTLMINGNDRFLCISVIGTSMLVRAWTAASPALDAQRNQSSTWITLSMWWSGCLSFTHDEETWRSTSSLHQAHALNFWPEGESSTGCTSHLNQRVSQWFMFPMSVSSGHLSVCPLHCLSEKKNPSCTNCVHHSCIQSASCWTITQIQ